MRNYAIIKKYSKGFTLIEILAAFFIFSLIFAVGVQLGTVSLRTVALTHHYNQVAFWAESTLIELRHSDDLKEGTESGSYNERINWELTISAYDTHWSDSNSDTLEKNNLNQKNNNLPGYRLLHAKLHIIEKNTRHNTTFTTLIPVAIDTKKTVPTLTE
ncbi:MAG: prepilin-type N-terminal cleavage/methylation domain-containing protein [Candidatus Endobugula sp.]|jgi:prepilin-type N-terminal cleavage/methylation domain-containing protein